MKLKIYTSLIFLLFFVHKAIAQTGSTDNAQKVPALPNINLPNQNVDQENANATIVKDSNSTKTETALNTITAELKNLRKEIEKQTNKVLMDSIHLQKDALVYVVHPSKKHEATAIRIPLDSAMIVTQDGNIIHLIIYSGKYKFSNGRSPIALTAHRFSKKDFLHNVGEGPNYSIVLQFALNFAGGRSYAPDDTTLVLRQSAPVGYFTKGAMLNTILDLRLYSDALGLFGRKDNGLIQIDGRAKYYIHQSNYPNKPVFFLHYLNANINLAKFDSKAQYLDSSNISRSSILQKSWFNGELSINGFDWLINGKSTNVFYGDIGAGISAATMIKNGDSNITVISQNIYAEIGIHMKTYNNYGFNFNLRSFYNYSPQTSNYEEYGNKSHFFCKPSFEAYYNPLGDKSSRVFVRLNYWFDTNSLKENKNNFFQFQIGYSTTLSKL